MLQLCISISIGFILYHAKNINYNFLSFINLVSLEPLETEGLRQETTVITDD